MKGFLLLLIGIILGAGAAGGYFYYQNQAPVAMAEKTPPPTTSPPQKLQKLGNISGSLSYPSEGIPDNLKVCAENADTKETLCTSEHLESVQFDYGKGYNIEVSPGSYTVYAQIPGDTYKAYYSDFVSCGLTADCPSHEPIVVKVEAGKAQLGINPQDWYVPQP